MMDTNEFLDRVMYITGIRSRDRAGGITRAVLISLRNMVQQHASNHVAERIPEDLWPRGPVDSMSQLVPTFGSYDMHGFLARVQQEACLEDAGDAERMSRAVLRVLHHSLDAHTITMIAEDLPGDVRVMWMGLAEAVPPAQADEEQPNAAVAERHLAEQRLAEEIEGLLELCEDLDASSINVQVMHGEVILRGTVRSEREREAVLRVVDNTLQSTAVRNEVEVELRESI